MKKIIFYSMALVLIGFSSCKKYLDAKSDSTLSTFSSMGDVQSLLDNFYTVNATTFFSMENSSDDFYLTQPEANSLFSYQYYLMPMYTWQNSGIFGPTNNFGDNDWSSLYSHVYQANTVLERIETVPVATADQGRKNDIKGQGYFLRGYSFLQLILTFGKGYNSATASADPGLPLRLSTDFNQKIDRSSVDAAYKQIISDLKTAAALLPVHIATPRPTRPGKAAAYAALARAYLSMRDYANSLRYADSSLVIKSDLVDYNSKDTSSVVSSPLFDFDNTEIEYLSASAPELPFFGNVDSTLYNSYLNGDLRRKLYFMVDPDRTHYKVNCPAGFFNGPAVDEVYLMRAECNARGGDITSAMADLNTLMKNRISKTSFIPLTAGDAATALALILKERRKELVGRSLRWMDLKRLNLEGANITLTRTINNQTYSLAPNSPRYAMPIPDDAIVLSGLQQNQY